MFIMSSSFAPETLPNSILAEGILRRDGASRFNAFSAGSQPQRVANPYVLETLKVKTRISLMLSTPTARLDKLKLKARLQEIGETEGASDGYKAEK